MSNKSWDPWSMYDVSPEEMRAIRERAKRRQELKAEWMKKSTNPYQAIGGPGGALFDPAIQRFISLKATTVERFRGTFRSAVMTVLLWPVPIALFSWYQMSRNKKIEESYRAGEVKYRDRWDKFVY